MKPVNQKINCKISERGLQIIQLIVAEYSTHEIATQLCISS